jgi:hypothetical protein
MQANRTVKPIVSAIAVVMLFGSAVWMGRPYVTDREFLLSRVAYDWRDARFAAFHRLYLRIQPGMTRNELNLAIEQVYPPDGRRKRPRLHGDTPTSIILFLHDEGKPGPNCEGIILTMTNARVVSKQYSPD